MKSIIKFLTRKPVQTPEQVAMNREADEAFYLELMQTRIKWERKMIDATVALAHAQADVTAADQALASIEGTIDEVRRRLDNEQAPAEAELLFSTETRKEPPFHGIAAPISGTASA